ncbi:MAG: FAD-linked oxidase C-terminal domain-containing protein [Desulfurivibrio sp.]|nr:FAD-linked oxidase C-terminal domain-containing protein [Desulfurivibrio sp.]
MSNRSAAPPATPRPTPPATGQGEPLSADFLREVKAVVGAGQLDTGAEARASYAYDGSGREYLPAAVVYPRDRQEIAAIMRLASRYRVVVTPRGAGTGMAGGALAVAGGVVLALAGLNKILEIDPANRLAVVQPGVITAELQAAVAHHHLYYPPDPASRAFCTIGGNVACNAGGPAAVKYGVTGDYVLGLEAVLPDGRLLHTGVRTAKGVVGYDLTRLLVGSEGTLAIITAITLRLRPAPAGRQTLLLLCPDMHRAAALTGLILNHLTPSILEYLDPTALELVRDQLPAGILPGNGPAAGEQPRHDEQRAADQPPPQPPAAAPEQPPRHALLLLEFDGDPPAVAGQVQQLRHLLAPQPDIVVREAADQQAATELWAARRGISPAAFRLRPHKISEDVVVPGSRIPELVAHTETLAAEHRLPIFTFGHAGDGNIHVNIMLDRHDPQETTRGEAARAALYDQVLALGGTLSGEHGVGIGKATAAAAELDPTGLALMRQLKELFDPLNILNPGKLFP